MENPLLSSQRVVLSSQLAYLQIDTATAIHLHIVSPWNSG